MVEDVPRRATDLLSPQEIKALTRASDLHGFLATFTTWGLIVAALVIPALVPHPAVILASVLILGGRQLGLAILMHEAAHRSLFRTRWINDFVGYWMGGVPIWQRLEGYRLHHRRHHARTNTDADPDRALSAPFPVTPASLVRKFARDAVGLTGLRRMFGQLLMDLGIIKYSVAPPVEKADPSERTPATMAAGLARHTLPFVAFNVGLWALAYALGAGWVWLLWFGAYLTSFSAFIRMRSIAEHACTSPSENPFLNTRTTRANLLAKLTVAPHGVNYHLEHHLLPTVPAHQLPELHRLLHERGGDRLQPPAANYREVLRLVSRPA